MTSALHRARSALGEPRRGRDRRAAAGLAAEREVVARSSSAFEGGDVDGVVALLTADALADDAAAPLEYHGPAAIGRFLSTVPAGGRLELSGSFPRGRTASRRSGYQLDQSPSGTRTG